MNRRSGDDADRFRLRPGAPKQRAMQREVEIGANLVDYGHRDKGGRNKCIGQSFVGRGGLLHIFCFFIVAAC
ncbi:hypothetical protein [Kineobactrum salinum]|uniref:Uncharacterized protein n=1 Tax=Kineobactrum salinum TaxID=2708301 RepID=A0A6C0U3N0_9GAMM|nr:hypothetical protein [Kineobactrum salinum]QIB64044.1 hypothetical protein G3T16_00875 [Kineobactrum salinum]